MPQTTVEDAPWAGSPDTQPAAQRLKAAGLGPHQRHSRVTRRLVAPDTCRKRLPAPGVCRESLVRRRASAVGWPTVAFGGGSLLAVFSVARDSLGGRLLLGSRSVLQPLAAGSLGGLLGGACVTRVWQRFGTVVALLWHIGDTSGAHLWTCVAHWKCNY